MRTARSHTPPDSDTAMACVAGVAASRYRPTATHVLAGEHASPEARASSSGKACGPSDAVSRASAGSRISVDGPGGRDAAPAPGAHTPRTTTTAAVARAA